MTRSEVCMQHVCILTGSCCFLRCSWLQLAVARRSTFGECRSCQKVECGHFPTLAADDWTSWLLLFWRVEQTSTSLLTIDATSTLAHAMASPAEVLRALQAHLDPNPLVQLLPTALQLFSHVMLLAEAVRSEALVALGHYESGKGALRAQDVRLLNACAVLLWDELYRLSLDVRRAVS